MDSIKFILFAWCHDIRVRLDYKISAGNFSRLFPISLYPGQNVAFLSSMYRVVILFKIIYYDYVTMYIHGGLKEK